MVRFYGLSPEAILAQPIWINDLLVRQMDAVNAEEMLAAMSATSASHLEPQARRQLLRTLEREAALNIPAAPVEVIEHDPEKAREYFESMGAIVS